MDTETLLPRPTTSPTSTPTSTPPSLPSTGREYSAGNVIAIVVGCLMLLPAFGMLVGGGAAASAQAFATDDGYFRFTPDRVGSDGVAVAATDLWLDGRTDDDAPDWLLDALDVDLRIRVSGARSTDEVFVGIAHAPDVERYLAGAWYSNVVEMDGHAPRYDEVAGSRSIDVPGAQDFWVVSASGDGEQELRWDARGGNWSAVVMNADGSPAVAADVEIGVRSDAVMPIAIVLMTVGVLMLAGAVVLIVVGVRGRREHRSGESGLSTSPLPPPAFHDAIQLDDDGPSAVG